MISKECFCKLIDVITKYDAALDSLPDWVQFENFPLTEFGFDIIDLLDAEMGTADEENGGLICSWIYDYKCGKDYGMTYYIRDEMGKVTKLDEPIRSYLVEIDGVSYAPETAEELYDLIPAMWTKKTED